MRLKPWYEGKIKKLKWYSLEQAKAATFFFTLFLITAWPAFLEFVLRFEWYWYLIISFVIGGSLIKMVLKR